MHLSDYRHATPHQIRSDQIVRACVQTVFPAPPPWIISNQRTAPAARRRGTASKAGGRVGTAAAATATAKRCASQPASQPASDRQGVRGRIRHGKARRWMNGCGGDRKGGRKDGRTGGRDLVGGMGAGAGAGAGAGKDPWLRQCTYVGWRGQP
ncbi:hypothetical protein BKA81DRAFT_189357 [Phyllosticta paracitricarpa]